MAKSCPPRGGGIWRSRRRKDLRQKIRHKAITTTFASDNTPPSAQDARLDMEQETIGICSVQSEPGEPREVHVRREKVTCTSSCRRKMNCGAGSLRHGWCRFRLFFLGGWRWVGRCVGEQRPQSTPTAAQRTSPEVVGRAWRGWMGAKLAGAGKSFLGRLRAQQAHLLQCTYRKEEVNTYFPRDAQNLVFFFFRGIHSTVG